MPEILYMPKLGMTMEKGTITSWYAKEGDSIGEAKPIVEVMTDKANMDVEAPASGVLYKILATEGEEVDVGKPIAIIRLATDTEEDLKKLENEGLQKEKEPLFPTPQEESNTQEEKTVESSVNYVPATPLAKKIVREKNIDLKNTQKNEYGIVTEKSLYGTAESTKEEFTLSPIQKAMAEKMIESSKIPQFTLYYEIIAEKIVEINAKLKSKGYNSSITPLLAKLIAQVLDLFPIFNTKFDGEKLILYKEKNIGVAVATQFGLFVPVIKGVDKLSLKDLFNNFSDFVSKANSNSLTLADLEGGTVAISNLGMYEVDAFTALLVPGQTAIFAVSAIKDKLIIENNSMFVKKVFNISISCDHRIIDGATASKLMQTIKKNIEVDLDDEVEQWQ